MEQNLEDLSPPEEAEFICVSHFVIPHTDKIQIVVSRIDSETDIKVTTMNRSNRLPPLVLPGDQTQQPRTKFLYPSSQRNTSGHSKSGKDGGPASPSCLSIKSSRCSSSEKALSTCTKEHLSVSGPGDENARSRSRSEGNTPSFASLPQTTSGSRYHKDCVTPPMTLGPFPCSGSGPTYQFRRGSYISCNSLTPSPQKSTSTLTFSSPSRSRSRSPSSPFTSRPVSRRGSAGPTLPEEKPLEPERVEQFLKTNPDFLEEYIAKNVSSESLEKWLTERQKIANTRRLSLSHWKFGRGSEKYAMLKRLAVQLNRNPPEGNVLWELALCISSAVSASSYVLYLLDKRANALYRFSPLQANENFQRFSMDDPKNTIATYVAVRREPQRMTRKDAIQRFHHGLGDENVNLEGSHYVLCHPIIRADSEVSGVIELHREEENGAFFVEDEEIVNSYLVWGGIALHYAEINSVMNKQKKLNDFLLGVVKSIFQDMVSMDAVIKKVMNFAQKLVDADRASLFLLDSKTKELYARIFDMGGGQDLVFSGSNVMDGAAKEIRFPIGTGIAGQVATTGQTLNIIDAYEDDRFNRSVDQVTGYLTKSILCMPVFIRSTVIGVVQMVNKRLGPFTKDDEEAFETFAVYCGLALHHAKLYDKIRRSEQKYKVALEVLSYHNTCTDEEFDKVRHEGLPEQIVGLDDFFFKPMSVDHMRKVHYAVYMFVDLFGLNRFDLDTLYRFTLTVKKNYRQVPYHNWSHGFTVANCMYSILKRSQAFRPLECLSLFIGSLCHDLDHRGKNNKFMLDSASPLALIYSTSTMEHHHFNQTVTILQQEGHNIFAKLGSEEYKQVLGNIKHCILATDLALFFTNKAKLQQLVDRDIFSWGVSEHRLLVQAIAMTASDLCASSKPWDIQVDTVRVIFEEFYEQGDLEKRAGRIPIPMMDRDQADEQPASQVGFINGICIPCYALLNRLIPETLPLLEGCRVNLERWKVLVEQQQKHKAAQLAIAAAPAPAPVHAPPAAHTENILKAPTETNRKNSHERKSSAPHK